MIVINIKPDLKPMQRAFQDFRAKQVPFATALALTRLAKGVQAEEQKAIASTFDSPTPFTLNSITVKPATKRSQVAVVYPREIAEKYLAPYVVGGDRSLGGKKGMLVPVNVPLNQYGNLTRGALANLKAKPDVFVGKVRTKSGKVISGVWQGSRPSVHTGRRRGKRAGAVIAKPAGHLKLLIKFEDSTPAPEHLAFYERAAAYLKANAPREFAAAMRVALATSRRR